MTFQGFDVSEAILKRAKTAFKNINMERLKIYRTSKKIQNVNNKVTIFKHIYKNNWTINLCSNKYKINIFSSKNEPWNVRMAHLGPPRQGGG